MVGVKGAGVAWPADSGEARHRQWGVSGQGGSPGWGAHVGGLWRPIRGGLASLDHSEAHMRVGEAGQMLEQRVHGEQSFAGEEM